MENLIEALDNSNYSNKQDPSPDHVLNLISQISMYYLNLTDYSKLDQDLAISFPQPGDESVGGLLQFLKSQITLKPHDKSKVHVLHLISWVVQNSQIPKHLVGQYVIRFKETADLAWRNQNERSAIQNAALEVLIDIFKIFGSQFKFHELEAAQLYHNLLVNSEKSCFQPSVRGHMLNLLGLLARNYGNDILNKEEQYMQLFNHLVSNIREEVECSHRHLEVAILLGAIRAVDSFLVQFQRKIPMESHNMIVLYKKLEQIIDPKCSIEHNIKESSTAKLKRREFQRAGLELVANHGHVFAKHLAKSHEQWFCDLLSWVKSNNIDDSRVGMKAMFRFLESVAAFYQTSTSPVLGEPQALTEEKTSSRTKAVNYFTGRFRIILDNLDTQGREVIVAVKGYSLISQICQDDDFADDVIFRRIVKRVEGVLSELEVPLSERRDKYSKYGSVTLLSTYVESIGLILRSMKISDEESLSTFHNRLLIVEELSIALVVNFPQLSEKYRHTASYSFNLVFTSLYLRHFKWCRPFLEKVVHEGLTHAISSPTKTEVDILTESYTKSGNEKELKKLNLKTIQSYVPFWIDLIKLPNTIVESKKLLYDVIMQWILETIAKLDLTLEFIDAESDEQTENYEVAVDPVYNTKATMARDFQLFINLVEFIEAFVQNTSAQYFEKWISVLSDDTISFIEIYPLVSGFYKIIALVFDMIRKMRYFESGNEDENVKVLFKKCCEFMNTLSFKVDEFRDDLLLSVLNIYLSAPDEIIVQHFIHLERTMKTVFRTGRTCFSLAARGVEALERWFQMEQINTDKIETLFRELFPILKLYFATVGQDETFNNDDIIKIKNSGSSFNSKKSFKKSSSEMFQRRFRRMQLERKDVTLRNLQLAILRLFGSFGHFLNLDSCDDSEINMNIEEKFLKYALPFQDVKPDIYLEKLLPRVIELCNLASERQLRTSSCECLHSIILYFLGHSVHSTSSSPHGELLLKLFSTMMKLGCDPDTVVRQLFNPLTIQVIHWFTRKDSQNYGDIVLQLIAENLAQSEDAQMRDFSVVCLSEFYSWSVKHENNIKIKQIIKTLCAMGTHAATKYRQGSVLAFNSIYREFREDEELVSTYVLQLIHSYVVSLGLPSNLTNESILVKSTQQAISHLERILLKKKDRFNTNIRGRKYPADLNGPCLKNLVDWIFAQSGLSSTSVGREVCLSLVRSLAPSIRGLGTVEEFLFEYQKTHGEVGIIGICEHYPSEVNVDDAYNYFDQMVKPLTASADIYLSLHNGGYPAAKLLNHTESKFVNNLGQLLSYDISHFTRHSGIIGFLIKIGQIMNLFHAHVTSTVLNCFIKISLFISKNVPGKTQSLKSLLIVVNELWGKLFLSEEQIKSNLAFILEIKHLLNLSILVDQAGPLNLLQTAELLTNSKWLNELTFCSHLINILTLEDKQALISQIWNYINSTLFVQKSGKDGDYWISQHISFRCEELLQNLLVLAFGLGLRDNVIQAVFDSTPVLCMDTKAKAKLTKGGIFQRVLLPGFYYNPFLINFKFLQDQTKLENVGLLVQSLLAYAKNKKDVRKRFGRQLVSSTIEIWQQLHLNCEANVLSRIISGLTSLDLNFCRNSKQLSKWWSSSLIMTNSNLTLKEKSEFIHFFVLFGFSSDPEVVNGCVETMEVLVKQSLKPTPNFNWTQEEHYITKVFFKLLNVYEGIPNNMKLLEVLIKYIIKCTILIELQVDEDTSSAVTGDDKSSPRPKLADNICGIKIRNILRKIITNLAEEDMKVKIAETIFKTITDASSSDCRTNLAGNTFCLIPVIGSLPDNAFKTFYRRNILTIIEQIEAKPISSISVPCWNLKTIAMSLIEMLALKGSYEFIIGNDLNQSFCQLLNTATNTNSNSSADGRLLLRRLVKITQSYRPTPLPSQRDKVLRTANFNFNAASFNATVALCVVAQLEPKFVTGFVFRESEQSAKEDHIWANIINTGVRFTFPLVMDSDLMNEKSVLSDEKVIQTKIGNDSSTLLDSIFQQSNRGVVAESSLADDASRFDFTKSIKVSESKFYQKIYAGINPYQNQVNDNLEFVTPPELQIEWSPVNEQPCMFSLIQAMKKMKTFPVEKDWVNALKYQIEKSTTHPNVKAFIIGAIMNCDVVFKSYATQLIDPILQCVLDDTFPTTPTTDLDSTSSQKLTLNHFVKDIIIMLLDWSSIAKPSASLIKSTLEYFIKRVDVENRRKDVLQNNLQVLQAIISHWVISKELENTTIPYDENQLTGTFRLITQALEKSDPKSPLIGLIGLNLAKYFMLGGVVPCKLNDVSHFIDHVSRSFGNTSKVITSTAGEVLGILFSLLDTIKFIHIDKALEKTKKKLDRERGHVQTYMNILSSIGKKFPSFLVPFKCDILSLLKNSGVWVEVLKILVDIVKAEIQRDESEEKKNQLVENLYTDLEGRGVFNNELKNGLLIGVEFLHLIIATKLGRTEGKIKQLIGWTHHAEFGEKGLRANYASAISKIYQNFGGHKDDSDSISNKCEKLFVRLLFDDEEEVQLVVQEFWAQNLKCYSQSESLLLELMEILGDNQNAIKVLLDLTLKRCSLSPDFRKSIFDKDLAECHFQHYDINTSWRIQTSMQPLFAESLSASQNFSLFPKAVRDSVLSQRHGTQLGLNMLRSTLRNFQFTQTQEGQNLGSFSQSQDAGEVSMDFDDPFGLDSEEFFEMLSSNKHISTSASMNETNPLYSLRRRFYERASTSTYATKEIERQQTLVDTDVEKIRKRRGEVKLSRAYRIGELPDIIMKHSELLASIISLVKKDEELGKTFLILLASGFVICPDPDEDKLRKFVHNSNITFDRILTNYGYELSPQFAEAILEISVICDIPIKLNHISNMCRRFGLERIGILKMENGLTPSNSILVSSTSMPPPKRPRVLQEPQPSAPEQELWIRLGDLYKQLEDFDTVRNVFTHLRDLSSDKISFYEKAREGLYLESLSKYLEAQDRYEELFQSENNVSEAEPLLLQFLDDALYKVMAHLTDWDGRYTRSHEFYVNHKDELQSDNYQSRILPNQITSGVQIVLRNAIVPEEGEDNITNFKMFIQTLKDETEDWKAIMERFPTDLAIFQLTEEDESRAQSLLDSGWVNCLISFQSFERLSKKEKKNSFLELQKSSILYDMLNWIKGLSCSVDDIEDKSYTLVEKWRKSNASSTIPLYNADLIIAERSSFLQIMNNKVGSLMIENKDQIVDDITRLQFEQSLWVVRLASMNGNADVGNYYLDRARRVAEGCDEEELLVWRNSLCQLLTACHSSYTMKDWIKQWSSSWKKLAKLHAREGHSTLLEVQCQLLGSLILKVTGESDSLPTKCLSSLCDAFSIKEPTCDYNGLMRIVLDSSVSLIGKAIDDEDETSQYNIVTTSAEVAMKFYHLIKSVVTKFPNEKYKNSEVLHEQLLVCLFTGIRAGHKSSVQLFPTCFEILETFPSLIDKAVELMKDIQSWIMLPWLDQIVTSYKHRPILTALLKPIIERMRVDFPQAFQLQYTDLDIINNSPLPAVLINFQKALEAIVLPEVLVKNHFSRIAASVKSETLLKTEIGNLLQLLDKIKQNPEFYGRIHQEYVDEIRPQLSVKYQMLTSSTSEENQETVEPNNSNRLVEVVKDVMSILNPKSSTSLSKNLYDRRGGKKEILDLRDLSPWLDKYHFASFKDSIEIPGLYTKFTQPEVGFHPKIVSFEPTVTIFSSKTSPIRLTLVANNGQKFPFLMKFGDDLRQDKRIQQLFSLFNQILGNDSRCRERDLDILTYSVIPVSKEFGMIELVRKTISVKNFILNSTKYLETFGKCYQFFSKFVSKGTPYDANKNTLEAYSTFAGKNRTEVSPVFDQIVNKFPESLFRDNVKHSAETLHSYFILREKLIRSYATICIVHYLLGIGDRHLENNMLKLSTGQFLGIDFGYAFGSATADLRVPELVPFRLTPQLQNLMAPYGPNGIFKETMLHTWRAIVKSSELVSSVVEIFVTEPTVDWSRKVRKLQEAPVTSQSGGLPAVQLLRDKLNKVNPLEISDKLLQMNLQLQSNKAFADNWKKVLVEGREEIRNHALLNDEQIIDTLISLASDKNVLSKMYAGWGAWV